MFERAVPLFFNLKGLRIVVFGGGNVALRKCRYLEGASITVVAEKVLPELYEIANKVIERRIPDNIEPLIDDFDMVIAATDDKVLNDKIRDDAHNFGINVNSAHGGGNILIPSVLCRDNYTIAVSSGGRAPAFPPYLIGILDGLLDERYDRMVDLLVELRRIIKERISDQHSRRLFIESVLSDQEVIGLVADGKMSQAIERALIAGGIE